MKSNIAWTLIALAAFGADKVMPYLEGRSNAWWATADLLPLLLLLACCVFLLSSAIRSLFSKRHQVAKSLLFIASMLLLGACFLVLPAETFHRGFTEYARTVLTADEWRAIARYARDHQKTPANTESSSSQELNPELREGLESATSFRKLNHSPRIFADSEQAEIYWGGALTGHRVVIVFAHKGVLPPQGRYPATFIAEDIATYITED